MTLFFRFKNVFNSNAQQPCMVFYNGHTWLLKPFAATTIAHLNPFMGRLQAFNQPVTVFSSG